MKKLFLSAVLMLAFIGTTLNLSLPQVAAAATDTCTTSFLGFPAWYKGLTNDPPDCTIKSPGSGKDELSKFIWHIAFNVVEMALVAVRYVALAFIIYGGFTYLTSLGVPDDLAKARKTILNAVIGLVISFAAVIFVNFITTSLFGS